MGERRLKKNIYTVSLHLTRGLGFQIKIKRFHLLRLEILAGQCALSSDTLSKVRIFTCQVQTINFCTGKLILQKLRMYGQFWCCFISIQMGIFFLRSMPTATNSVLNAYFQIYELRAGCPNLGQGVQTQGILSYQSVRLLQIHT